MVEHLEKALSDLVSQREQNAVEIAKLDSAIEAIQKLIGSGGERVTDLKIEVSDRMTQKDSVHPVIGFVIKPGDLFGKSQAEAAQEYLKRRDNAASLDEIFSALKRGGASLKGKNPKKNLYISLVKKKGIFALVAPYTFGLWEFYPNAKQKNVRAKGGRQSQMFEQLEEVMRDGKVYQITKIVALLDERFGQKFSRSTVVSALRRGAQFRKARRGRYKLTA